MAFVQALYNLCEQRALIAAMAEFVNSVEGPNSPAGEGLYYALAMRTVQK